MSKKLVAYFSASGVTAAAAKLLAQATGADLYEIQPQTPYTQADLNWRDKQSRSSIEMNDPASRPAIAGPGANIAKYDTIFIGFPIWWYVAPTIINTFLESADFSEKTLIPFATSGGSGLGETVAKLKPSAPNATWGSGNMLNGRLSAEAIAAWIAGLGIQ